MLTRPTLFFPAVAAFCLALGPGAARLRADETEAPSAWSTDAPGLYEIEGAGQGDPIEWILGMRADRTPTGAQLRALEIHPVTRDKVEQAITAFSRHRERKASLMDAAAGFGSNVCYASPLIQQIEADLLSGHFGTEGRPLFLDVGAGVGYNTRRLVDLGAQVVANDQSTEQLAILRGYLGTGLGTGIYLNDGDIFAKAFPAGSFDGILASHLFHYLRPAELEALVPRFRQWLRPGGRLYLQCWNIEASHFSHFRPIWEDKRKAGRPWPGSIENAHQRADGPLEGAALDTFRENFPDYVHAVELEDLVKLLNQSGFSIIQAQANDFPARDERGRWSAVPACEVMVVAQAGAGADAAEEKKIDAGRP